MGVFVAVTAALSHGAAQADHANGVCVGKSSFRQTFFDRPADFDPLGDMIAIDCWDTDVRPPASGVARNTQTGDEVTLRFFEPGEWFENTPYSSGKAAGDWVITLRDDRGTHTDLIPTFGTGPGTGPLPPVENVTVSGFPPQICWTPPPDLENVNDGNVDRFRIRLYNYSNGFGRILDQRLSGLTSTCFSVAPGTITRNGVYRAEVLLEGFDPFVRSRVSKSFQVTQAEGGGSPVRFTDVYQWRENRGPNTVSESSGDALIKLVTVDEPAGTQVFGGGDGEVMHLFQFSQVGEIFSRRLPWTPSLAGAWAMTASNGANTDSATLPARRNAPSMPLADNVRVDTTSVPTATVHFELPGSGPRVDRIGIGLHDDETNAFQLLAQEFPGTLVELPPTARSYTYERLDRDGNDLMENGRDYVARVVLIHDDSAGSVQSRSVTYVPFVASIDREPPPDGATTILPIILDVLED